MFVINNSARLITIAFDGEKYPLMPAGDAVEIPDEAKEECKFLDILRKEGSVSIVEDSAEQAKTDPLEALRGQAIALGVEGVTKRWGEAKLRAAIEEASAEDDNE